MKKLLIYFSLLIFLTITTKVLSAPMQLKIEYDDTYKQNNSLQETPVLTGGISQVQELPRGMYGTWQVRGTLLETNDLSIFSPHSNDVWILRKDGAFVTLINPKNGARATITVNEVQNNSATFSRQNYNGVVRDKEQVHLTLEGDTFYGTDLIVSEKMQYGVSKTSVARYRVIGVKLSGDSLYQKTPYNRFSF